MSAAGHPEWCASEHPSTPHVHSVSVGDDVDLPVDTSLFVELLQVNGQDVHILLGEHHSQETSVRSLTLDHALQLRDRLNTATALALREGADRG